VKDRGEPIDRVDGKLKVTGGAQYAVEVPVNRVAYAVLVTSPMANARITRVDFAKAERAPGVLAVLSHGDAPKLPPQPTIATRVSPTDRQLQLFQDDRVHYANQPIACVVADTLEHAQRAAALVDVAYERGEVTVAAKSRRRRKKDRWCSRTGTRAATSTRGWRKRLCASMRRTRRPTRTTTRWRCTPPPPSGTAIST
jgi:xanthine dehydrogenase YagR molybdenum-binding subunit